MDNPLSLPLQSLYILHTLQQNSFAGYIVGGAVRDLLLASLENTANETTLPKWDFDFTTNATPEQISEIFANSFYENQFGTVSITQAHLWEQMGVSDDEIAKLTAPIEKPPSNRLIDLAKATKVHSSLEIPDNQTIKGPKLPVYEMTTFRSEDLYEDFRRPTNVTWGNSIEEDLKRRDFTINAMALSVSPDFLNDIFAKPLPTDLQQLIIVPRDQFTIIDPHAGLADLQSGLIKTVGNPTERFHEDALRPLRAIRFSVQLNMQITDETYQAITSTTHNIQHVSWERIRDEFLKMLHSDYPKEAIELLDDTGVLSHILPEIQEGKGVDQGGHHTTDVWTHSLDALTSSPSRDPIVKLATLLHDIGKPRTYKLINNQPTFYNHEVIGARIARDIAYRLRLSKHDQDRIFILVRYHMFYYQPENTDAAIRRFMRKVGLENIDDILDLREADRLGSGARRTSWRLEEMKERMKSQLHQPLDVTDLAINGSDLMSELNLQPGPKIGTLLQQLFELVMEDPDKNTREILLAEARQLLAENYNI